jgi:hypothetical protein
MHAGPYIQRCILFQIETAHRLRIEAVACESRAIECRKEADAADQRASKMAAGTDFTQQLKQEG